MYIPLKYLINCLIHVNDSMTSLVNNGKVGSGSETLDLENCGVSCEYEGN